MASVAAALAVLLTACGSRQPADDLTISTKVKIELLSDPRLGAMRVNVSTLNGVVTLSGTVDSPADVERAAAAAKRVAGVRGVKSELRYQQQLPATSYQLPVTSFQLEATSVSAER